MNDKRWRSFAYAQNAAEVFAITYWVPHEDEGSGNASLFQNFSEGIVRSSELFAQVVTMPYDIRELFADRSCVKCAVARVYVNPSSSNEYVFFRAGQRGVRVDFQAPPIARIPIFAGQNLCHAAKEWLTNSPDAAHDSSSSNVHPLLLVKIAISF